MEYLSPFLQLPKRMRLDLIEEAAKDNTTNKYTHYVSKCLHLPEDGLIGLPLSVGAIIRFSVRGPSLEVRVLDIKHPQVKEALECLKTLQCNLDTIIEQYVQDYELDRHLPNNTIPKVNCGNPAVTHELIKPVFVSNDLDTIRGILPRVKREARILLNEDLLIKLAEWYNGGALLKFNK